VPTRARFRIQIVDANRFILTCLGDYLTSAGFEVLTAESPENGLRQHSFAKPDLIILDLDLGGMGGMGFLRKLADESGALSHPVLVFSDRADLEPFCREHFRIEGFLPKQAFGRELGEAILHALQRRVPALPSPEEPRTSGQSVLLAEDEPRFAENLRLAFIRAGFTVTLVDHGPAVLKQAPIVRPDVVVLKQVIPGMNGTAVAGLLVSIPETMRIPVVLYDDTGTTRRFAQRGNPEGVTTMVEGANPAMIVEAARSVLAKVKANQR
jgi:DNA-binding response OmpR family regulator